MFKGYFLKAITADEPFPMNLIEAESWDSSPNQREQLKAERDDNTRDLFLLTAKGTKSKFSFSTMDNIHLADKIKILDYFTKHETDKLQRKIYLEYWNDEESAYKTAYFYRPDIQYKIKEVDAKNNDIIYSSMKITFVEF